MAVRTAEAEWKGNLREGKGEVRLGSGAFQGSYSFASRFEEGTGTNPEELIGAAHAGCFSMALAGELTKAGYNPTSIHTTERVHINKVGDGWQITKAELHTKAQVPGIDDAAFQKCANMAKTGCPVSRALAAVPEITLEAELLA